ncbi:MAG: hypothetical protein M9949_06050 [Candidatus Kapabacteria bacterium]|nr:hypothetical protein [Candidatus Kapabacteria bacterium]
MQLSYNSTSKKLEWTPGEGEIHFQIELKVNDGDYAVVYEGPATEYQLEFPNPCTVRAKGKGSGTTTGHDEWLLIESVPCSTDPIHYMPL